MHYRVERKQEKKSEILEDTRIKLIFIDIRLNLMQSSTLYKKTFLKFCIQFCTYSNLISRTGVKKKRKEKRVKCMPREKNEEL